MLFPIVVAHDEKFGIAKEQSLPWKISSDKEFFRVLTSKSIKEGSVNSVIMGRRTWDSIPPSNRPLSGRLNIVLSRSKSLQLPNEVEQASSWDDVYKILGQKERKIDCAFIVGGGEIYRQALQLQLVDCIYATEIVGDFQCDIFLLDYKHSFNLIKNGEIQKENGYSFRFNVYRSQSHHLSP